jgi:transcriptional regulator with XRE-family HTH domain
MTVDDIVVYERLRQARISRGEDVASLGRRIGVSPRLLVAIEEGRFADLPGGIYTRTAIRLFAAALSFDADEVLAACDPLLPPPDDPIEALARLRGIRPEPRAKLPSTVSESAPPPVLASPPPGPAACPGWRLLASVLVDALAVMGLLLAAVAGTIPMSGGPPSDLGAAAPWVIGSLGLLLAAGYLLFFGGIGCVTIGERAMGVRLGRRNARPLDLRAVANRALRCSVRDLRFLHRLGMWTAGVAWSDRPSDSGRRTPDVRDALRS